MGQLSMEPQELLLYALDDNIASCNPAHMYNLPPVYEDYYYYYGRVIIMVVVNWIYQVFKTLSGVYSR